MGAITAELMEGEEKRDARGRRVTLGSRRSELVEAYRVSGLTMAAFARREGIKYSTFAHWVLKAQKETIAKPAIKFAELQLPLASASAESLPNRLEVRLPDGTVLCGHRVGDVVALVRALRS